MRLFKELTQYALKNLCQSLFSGIRYVEHVEMAHKTSAQNLAAPTWRCCSSNEVEFDYFFPKEFRSVIKAALVEELP
jgi:hypothetical protein